MSVSLDVYRSRIGSHDGSVKAKAASARLQAKFWNQMLFMFYLTVFYLPGLKRLINKYQQNSEVNAWFAQICYHASLLLKLSNDVEESTGPTTFNEVVDCNQTVLADFNQGDPRFGGNCGKQCAAMSLASIV